MCTKRTSIASEDDFSFGSSMDEAQGMDLEDYAYDLQRSGRGGDMLDFDPHDD